MNEVGDIQNWAEMIERDLLVLEETVRLVDDGKAEDRRNEGGERREENASGTSGWFRR